MSDLVLADISSAIQVRHILTPISAIRQFNRADDVRQVRHHLEENKFDFTPIFPVGPDGDVLESAGEPDGILQRSDLAKAHASEVIEHFVRPLASAMLIEAKASLTELIERFRKNQPFLVVVGGRGLAGVVTPSDLNKQAGRTQLFMQVCALELALADIVRASGRESEGLLTTLPKKRARAAERRYKAQRDRDEAADLVSALDLQDLLHVGAAWAEGGSRLSRLGAGQIEELSQFRNTIMHAVLEPAGDDELRLRQLLIQTELVVELLASLGPQGRQ